MGEAIGQTLPLAVGVALSPLAVIAVILLLSTPRARANAVAFLLGWTAGLMVAGGLLLVIGDSSNMSEAGSPAEWTGYLKIGLGLLLLVVAFRQKNKRLAPGEDPALPAWMTRLDSFGPVGSAGAGALLSGINPKNLVLTAAAAVAISQTGAAGADQVVALVVYALLASVTVAVPLGIYFFMSDRADEILGRLKNRMGRDNAMVMAVICVVIAAKLIGDGITTLSLF
ncbi:MAG: GAP family protein [Solirubrobacterales bacterium]|nr:GAP family protein [Solirubrobacterales bacterium]MCB0860581.1 GAP family protein [Solirubrobacterales bacterium]HRV59869.1 GAP family protein [Solirubrobacterales bacterium]